jgi:hypothetical protein
MSRRPPPPPHMYAMQGHYPRSLPPQSGQPVYSHHRNSGQVMYHHPPPLPLPQQNPLPHTASNKEVNKRGVL